MTSTQPGPDDPAANPDPLYDRHLADCRCPMNCGRLPADPFAQVASWAALGTSGRWGAHSPSARFRACWGEGGQG